CRRPDSGSAAGEAMVVCTGKAMPRSRHVPRLCLPIIYLMTRSAPFIPSRIVDSACDLVPANGTDQTLLAAGEQTGHPRVREQSANPRSGPTRFACRPLGEEATRKSSAWVAVVGGGPRVISVTSATISPEAV